jgi:hypothetical protein
MKPSDYPEPSPACELLRSHLREIYAPIQWEKVNQDLTPVETIMAASENFHTARSIALDLNTSVYFVLKLVHRNMIRPCGKCKNGTMLFTDSQLSEIKSLLTKP